MFIVHENKPLKKAFFNHTFDVDCYLVRYDAYECKKWKSKVSSHVDIVRFYKKESKFEYTQKFVSLSFKHKLTSVKSKTELITKVICGCWPEN